MKTPMEKVLNALDSNMDSEKFEYLIIHLLNEENSKSEYNLNMIDVSGLIRSAIEILEDEPIQENKSRMGAIASSDITTAIDILKQANDSAESEDQPPELKEKMYDNIDDLLIE